jgi:hypothetical protein
MRRYLRSFPIALLLLLGCGDLSSPTDPSFRTDAQKYTLTTTSDGYAGSISYVFTNPNTSPVTIPTCGGGMYLSLQKGVSGSWVPSYAPGVLKCGGPILVIAGGAQHHDTVVIDDCSFRSNCAPKFAVSPISGQYRIVWGEVLDINGAMLPEEQRTSNTFTISTSAP